MEKRAENSRLNIDSLMSKLQNKLGEKWDEYRETLSHFLMGKLSKIELNEAVSRLLGKDVHSHNYLLLAILANAFRELPPGEDTALNGWKPKTTTHHPDTPIELLQKEIMTLPPRERKRIRNITKDPNRKVANPPAALVATRQSMLPKIPYVQDKKNGIKQKPRKNDAPNEIPEGMHPPRLSGPLMWTQDIIHGFDTPLASESHEIPTDQAIGSRMLGIALENGLLRGIDAGTTDIMLASLDAYLDSIVGSLAQFTRNFTNDRKRSLGVSDLNSFFDARALEFQEVLPPMYRMKTEFLNDEDTASENEDNDEGLLGLVKGRPPKRSAQEAQLVQESEKGKQFIRSLLGNS